MKHLKIIIGIIVIAGAITAFAWKLVQTDSSERDAKGSASNIPKALYSPGSAWAISQSNVSQSKNLNLTKRSDRSNRPLDAKLNTKKPISTEAHERLKQQLGASKNRGALEATLPIPAAFIALDPAVSGIPPEHESSVQAMAEDAAGIVKSYEESVEKIQQDSALSPEDKSAALIEKKQKVAGELEAIDYLFRARYGARAWLAHHNAAHQAFTPQK